MRLLFAFVFITSFSSCFKVEDTVLCNVQVPTPSLSSASYSANVGTTFSIAPISDTMGLDVYWEDPMGHEYTGNQWNTFLYTPDQSGTWSVYSKKQVVDCISDKRNFTVTVNPYSPCNLSGNYFKLGTDPALSVTSTAVTANANFYRARFFNGSTYIDVIFQQAPADGGAYSIVTTLNAGSLQYYTCALQWYSGGLREATGGVVYTSYVGNKLKISFCGITIAGGGLVLTNAKGVCRYYNFFIFCFFFIYFCIQTGYPPLISGAAAFYLE